MEEQKKIFSIIVIAVALIILGVALYLSLVRTPQREQAPKATGGPEEVLRSLTAPSGVSPEVPKEVLKSLTSPSKKVPAGVPEEVLKSLTAPPQSEVIPQ